jgi:hypothetical protein
MDFLLFLFLFNPYPKFIECSCQHSGHVLPLSILLEMPHAHTCTEVCFAKLLDVFQSIKLTIKICSHTIYIFSLKNSIYVFCSLFKLDYYVLCYWDIGLPYNILESTPCSMYSLKIVSAMCKLFSLLCRCFLFLCNTFICFCFYSLYFWSPIHKILVFPKCWTIFPMFFLLVSHFQLLYFMF